MASQRQEGFYYYPKDLGRQNELASRLPDIKSALSAWSIIGDMDFQKVSKRVLRMLKLPPQLLYALGLGRWYGRLVLLLTTRGRKSGLPRITPLQYEVIDGLYYLGSSLGEKADWYRNIQANPQVELRVGERRFQGFAETTTDPERLVDFLLYRLKQHPRMIGTILRAEGMPANAGREELKKYSQRLALVIVHPQ